MKVRPEHGGLRVDAPAKLNLFLEILGKRPDGYHELETLMVTVGLYDTLEFKEEPTDCVRLQCLEADDGPFGPAREPIPVDDRNLVVRAARLLKTRADVTQGVSVTLTKRIPAAAGLAGGSSDAAATLVALNRLWTLGFSTGELQQLAAELGSDIPFFLTERPLAVCRGRGEIIEPLSIPLRLFAVIVSPSVGLSTAEVYRHSRVSVSPRSVQPLLEVLVRDELADVQGCLHNALQPAAEQLCPDVRNIAAFFETQNEGPHLMSGSGSAYFALCRQRQRAEELADRVRSAGLGGVAVAEVAP